MNANKERPYALYHLGIMYLNGTGVEKNKEHGLDLINQSANLGCSQACYTLSLRDMSPKSNLFLSVAKQLNNANVYLDLASQNAVVDGKMCVEFLKRAISAGSTYAIAVLANYYYDQGQYKKAKKYYKMGCKKDNAQCLFNLATMYANEDFGKVNNKKAIQLFQRSYELGHHQAPTCLGNLYMQQDDFLKSEKYYLIAIKLNDSVACYNLGEIYKMRGQLEKAIRMFILGAKWGNADSNRMLVCYGIKVESTDEEINKTVSILNNFNFCDINQNQHDID
jgi:hypothetical protein